MDDYQNNALFGGGASYPTMGADMLNPGAAQNSIDWAAVLVNGIRGAAQGAIGSQVQGAAAGGQIILPAAAQAQQRSNMTMLLVIGAAIYFATRG